MAKPKLIYVIADSSQTGGPTQVLYLMQRLKSEYDIHLFSPKGWLADRAKELQIPTKEMAPTLSRFGLRATVASHYRDLKPNIIHCHGVRGGLIGRLCDIPTESKVVYTEHLWTNDFHLPSRWREWLQISFLRVAGRKTDKTIAVSQAVKTFLISHGISNIKNTSVIYGGIMPIPAGKPQQHPVIGTLGNLTWVKGVDLLIKALPKVVKEISDVKCIVAGDGPDSHRLKALAVKFQVADRIKWLGRVNDPTDFFHQIGVYVQPSRSESFGMATLEAMSAGIPVVASDAGALPEIVQNNQNGLLFKSKDSVELAKDIITLLSDPDKRARLGQKGIKTAASYSVDEMVNHHHKLYQELI